MNSVLARFGLGDPVWLDPVTAVVIVLLSLLAALVYNKLLQPVALKLTHYIPTDLDSQIVQAFNRPVTAGIGVLGLYLGLTIPLELTGSQRQWIDHIAQALGIILGVSLVVGVVSRMLDWHQANPGKRTNVIDPRFFPLVRRMAVGVIYAIGFLLVLDVLSINISPLIAGMGLAGLAVALAIQPTLANLFAGTYVMSEGVISTGDYIELEGGVAGYVVEVSWRSTRIRTWGNNLVVIPNARLADTIITNYQEPTPAVNVYLTCGVSYESDLVHVEAISREVMEDLLNTGSHGVKEYGGWFGFESFGDSNVVFWLFLQARKPFGQLRVAVGVDPGLAATLRGRRDCHQLPRPHSAVPRRNAPRSGDAPSRHGGPAGRRPPAAGWRHAPHTKPSAFRRTSSGRPPRWPGPRRSGLSRFGRGCPGKRSWNYAVAVAASQSQFSAVRCTAVSLPAIISGK